MGKQFGRCGGAERSRTLAGTFWHRDEQRVALMHQYQNGLALWQKGTHSDKRETQSLIPNSSVWFTKTSYPNKRITRGRLQASRSILNFGSLRIDELARTVQA